VRLIVQNFQWQEQQFQGEIVHARYPFGLKIDRTFALSVLAAWADILNPGNVVLNFNWDLLHEATLWRAGKWHFGMAMVSAVEMLQKRLTHRSRF
jgi:hypothetical protein